MGTTSQSGNDRFHFLLGRRSSGNEEAAQDPSDELEELFGSLLPVLAVVVGIALVLAAVLLVEVSGSVRQLLGQ